MEKYLIAIISASGTLLVAIIGIFGNMYLANQNKKRELLIKEKEIKQQETKFLLENLKGFWEEQNQILKQALSTASILTFNEDIVSNEFQLEYKRLWKLIYGELPMYDVPKVEKAMEKIATLAYKKIRLDPKNSKAVNLKKKEMKPVLTNLALQIKETSIVLEYSKKIQKSIVNKKSI